MRSIWSGSISFGLVNIPVKLYSAQASGREIDFDMLHKNDLSPIRYARICTKEGKEVPYQEVTKGVDTGGGNYVVISQEDFDKALPKKTKTIEIVSFSHPSEIDSLYIEKPYYLEPDKQSDKPYQLLLKALEESEKVGVAKFVLRTKEHLALLRPYRGIMMLLQLRYDEEVADLSRLRFPAQVTLSEEEIELAKKLISQISKPFNPLDYHNTFTREMEEIIAQKVEGKEVVPAQNEPVATEVDNLIETLSKSLSKK